MISVYLRINSWLCKVIDSFHLSNHEAKNVWKVWKSKNAPKPDILFILHLTPTPFENLGHFYHLKTGLFEQLVCDCSVSEDQTYSSGIWQVDKSDFDKMNLALKDKSTFVFNPLKQILLSISSKRCSNLSWDSLSFFWNVCYSLSIEHYDSVKERLSNAYSSIQRALVQLLLAFNQAWFPHIKSSSVATYEPVNKVNI